MVEILKDIKKININIFDMMIIVSINFYQTAKNKCSVSDIRKLVDIAPNNLTQHIKKLEKIKLIKVEDFGIGKIKNLSLNHEDLKSSLLINGIIGFSLFHLFDDKEKTPLLEYNSKISEAIKKT
jgi:DNA-binding transcriptional ArsR family regulator